MKKGPSGPFFIRQKLREENPQGSRSKHACDGQPQAGPEGMRMRSGNAQPSIPAASIN